MGGSVLFQVEPNWQLQMPQDRDQTGLRMQASVVTCPSRALVLVQADFTMRVCLASFRCVFSRFPGFFAKQKCVCVCGLSRALPVAWLNLITEPDRCACIFSWWSDHDGLILI